MAACLTSIHNTSWSSIICFTRIFKHSMKSSRMETAREMKSRWKWKTGISMYALVILVPCSTSHYNIFVMCNNIYSLQFCQIFVSGERKKCHLKNWYAVKNINKCKQCANFFFPGNLTEQCVSTEWIHSYLWNFSFSIHPSLFFCFVCRLAVRFVRCFVMHWFFEFPFGIEFTLPLRSHHQQP